MARWNVRNSYNIGRAQLVRAGDPAGSCLCARSLTLVQLRAESLACALARRLIDKNLPSIPLFRVVGGQ